MSRRVVASFSGGRTSGLMLRRLLDSASSDTHIVTLFANTGQEDERTLEFVDRVDREWGVGVVWLEAVVHLGYRQGTTHRVVDFVTANRDGAVFESVIAKYGIPNKNYPGACTRELKLHATKSYLRSIGWSAGTYDTAIGIRADEIDRMSINAAKHRFIYPLVSAGITKADVLAFWRSQPFDLQVPEHLGNCTWCWKKSLRKHLTLAKDHPEVFDFPRRMEAKYADAGSGTGARVFFRGGKSAQDIFDRASRPFEPFVENTPEKYPINYLDTPGGGCTESCEIYPDAAIDQESGGDL